MQLIRSAEIRDAIRPNAAFRLWSRDVARLKSREKDLAELTKLPIAIFDTLEKAAASAQIISTITSAKEPILCGAWLKPGAHVDLVGAHTRAMAEADPDCFKRAKIFVDCRNAELEEAGDLIAALRCKAVREDDILGDLFDLASGRVDFARGPSDITLFKSVGHAFEDLVAATLIEKRLKLANP